MTTPETYASTVSSMERRPEVERPSIGDERKNTRRRIISQFSPIMFNPWDIQEVVDSFRMRNPMPE